MKTTHFLLPLLAAAQLLLPGHACAETRWSQPVTLSSGALSNLTELPQSHVIGLVKVDGAVRLRVPLAQATLGTASKVRFVSLKDGQSQTLDAAQLKQWGQMSGLLNGDTVRLEVILAPGDHDVTVRVKQGVGFVDVADPGKGIDCCGGVDTRTLCGPDDRVASTDNRVGRINGGCTGWLVSNGAVLTAGHCGIAAGQIFEVNVPASQADGTTVASAIQDQYPVIAGSIITVNSGIGNDYTVCRVGPNSLGQNLYQYGFFRMTRELPAAGAVTRVTGCGIDNSPLGSQPSVCGNFNAAGTVCTHFGLNAQNQTLQTNAGTFTGETGTGTVISLQYSVDTEPANSGSPIIWEANGFTIGIHTAGGCTAAGGSNNGTSFELNALEAAIAGVPGPNCRYLDFVKAPSGAEDGTVFQPHDTLTEALNSVPVGGNLSIVTGSYFAAGTTITKAMTISAPVGVVTLGN